AEIQIQRRESHVTLIESDARLRRAGVAAMRLRMQPFLLASILDAIAAAASTDPSICESMIASAGDLLRMLLRHANTGWLAVKEEIDLTRAYAEVVGSGSPIAVLVGDSGLARLKVPTLAIATLASSIREEIVRLHVAADAGVLWFGIVARAPRLEECAIDRE